MLHLELDGTDIYIFWGGVMLGVMTLSEWSYAIVNPKIRKGKAA